MMRNKRIWIAVAGIVLALVLLTLFTACGVKAGEVYDKSYHPSETYYVMVDDYMQQPYYDPNLKQWMNRQVWIGQHQEQRTRPECYQVKFQNDDGDKGDNCVSADEYETIDIGDWYEE
jgi:hypothetical protein